MKSIWSTVLASVVTASTIAADVTATNVSVSVVRRFEQADLNHDKQLSVDEFVAGREPVGVLRRDFNLFDVDADGSLTLEEYAPISEGVDRDVRGPISDPLVKLVDKVVAALDKSLNNWDERPNDELNARGFVSALSARFSNLLPAVLVKEADPDGNGKVSRTEARRFLEIQLGVRRPEGELLRSPNGLVNNYSLFLYVDESKNGLLERQEYVNRLQGGGGRSGFRPGG